MATTDTLVEGTKNWWTTVTGCAAGVGYYLSTQGAVMPSGKSAWLSFGVGLFLAALGIGAKDAGKPSP